MDAHLQLLRRVSTSLHKKGIEYMVHGDMAKHLYGLPCESENIEIIIALCKLMLPNFLPLSQEGFDIDEERISQLVLIRENFDIIDQETGINIRFNLLELGEPYQQTEFSRRKRQEIAGFETWVVGLEDLLITMLRSENPLQMETIHEILKIHHVDRSYLKKWGAQIDI